MNTQFDIHQAVDDACRDASNEMLREQNAKLTAQVEMLAKLVREIPGIITSARLDAREGKQTGYNYDRAHKALSHFLPV